MSHQPPDRPPEGWQPPPQRPEQEPSGGVRAFLRQYPLAFFGGILLVLVLAANLFGGNDESSDTDSRTPASERTDSEPEVDASTRVSCEHFRNIMSDVAQGVLNDAELRDKLKEVNDSASVSERDDIRAGAVAMLRAITTGTTEEFLTAAGEFDSACDRAGL